MEKITRQRLDRFVRAHVGPGRVIDIGAGGKPYSHLFESITTVDVDETVKPDVVGDVQSLPCEDNSFDIILCTEVLEHVQDPRRAIAEMHRVLRPGGRLVLTTRFLFPIHHPSHDFFRFTEAGLQSLFAGWNTFTIRPEASSFETIAILLQRMILQMRFRFNKLTKAVLLLLISFFLRSTWLIKDEYPHIEANTVSANIFSSGYYVVATK